MKSGSRKSLKKTDGKGLEKLFLDVHRMMLSGVPVEEIINQLGAGVSRSEIESALTESRDNFRKKAEIDEEEELGKAKERGSMIIAKSLRVQDNKTAVTAQKLISDLMRSHRRNQPVKNILKRYEKKITGRPSKYTDKLADEICERIANGESLVDIINSSHMPSMSTIYKWMDDNKAFSEGYARARKIASTTYIEYSRIILDNSSPEEIQVNAQRANQYRYMAEKFNPSQFSDRQSVELSGKNGSPVEINQQSALSPEQFAALADQQERVMETLKRKMEE